MIITAKFKGLPRIGYAVGFWYDLRISGNTITRIDGTGELFYSSAEAILNDWTDLETVNN